MDNKTEVEMIEDLKSMELDEKEIKKFLLQDLNNQKEDVIKIIVMLEKGLPRKDCKDLLESYWKVLHMRSVVLEKQTIGEYVVN
tara:strand:+ start:428 stop:679 length:252 start_codon:yes stop_codon:yes gene_type:complete